MSDLLTPSPLPVPERRRIERRGNSRIGDLTVPEVRRIIITTVLGVVVVSLFLFMVRTVIVAAILGLIIGFYIRPLHLRLQRLTGRPTLSAILTLLGVILPILVVLAYSYLELADVVQYAAAHQEEIIAKIDTAVRRIPFLKGEAGSSALQRMVIEATAIGTRIPLILKKAVKGFAIATTIFLFTTFYILLEADKVASYVSGKIPPRYEQLRHALENNVSGVLYGAIYSTLVTQTLKSVIILVMNLAFQVPLAGALAVMSFVIGFFPIVGSWSIYVPVALWLFIFKEATSQAIAMVVIGTLVNTFFISNYLRPKLAADRSGVLNFYWMFVALITGVYTFGLPGILLGPILIGLLKAVVDTVTSGHTWTLIDVDDEGGALVSTR